MAIATTAGAAQGTVGSVSPFEAIAALTFLQPKGDPAHDLDHPSRHRPAVRLRNHDVHLGPLRRRRCQAGLIQRQAGLFICDEDFRTGLGRRRRLSAVELQLRPLLRRCAPGAPAIARGRSRPSRSAAPTTGCSSTRRPTCCSRFARRPRCNRRARCATAASPVSCCAMRRWITRPGCTCCANAAAPLPLWCTDPVFDDLTRGNPVFGVLGHYCGVERSAIPLDGTPFTVPKVEGLTIRALPLASKPPPYSPRREQPTAGDNIGLVFEARHRAGARSTRRGSSASTRRCGKRCRPPTW